MAHAHTKKKKSPIAHTPAVAEKPLQPVKRELTDFQALVIDLAGDLALNGGDAIDVEGLVRAVLGHQNNLRFKCRPSEELVDRQAKDWLERLTATWPEEMLWRMPEEGREGLSDTPSNQVRERLRGRLVDAFSQFIVYAPMSEMWLLKDILEFRESHTMGADDPSAESGLAQEFCTAMGRDDTYVKVPRYQVELVEEYLKLLRRMAA